MKYKVFATRTEIYEAEIEASSPKEAEEMAENNYSDYDWNDVDGTL